MSTIITIPLLDINISTNTLVSTIVLLCIFFTFFSVSIELGGNLSPQNVADENNDCNQITKDQTAIFTTKWDTGVQDVLDDIKSVAEDDNALTNNF